MTINNIKDPYIEPSADIWELINRKAEESKDKVFLFILHCLRNKHSVSVSDIASYYGNIIKSKQTETRKANVRIGNITRWMKNIMGLKNGVFYIWNQNNAEWHIGHNSHYNLQRAFNNSGK